MFVKERTIKNRGFATVEAGIWKGQSVIKKQYFPEHKQRYYAEVQNLERLRHTIKIPSVVNSIYKNNSDLIIIFPYIKGLSGYDAIKCDNWQNILSRVFSAIVTEQIGLNFIPNCHFSFVPEGYKTNLEVFTYTPMILEKDIINHNQKTELRKLLRLPKYKKWTRYDPELSNIIVSSTDVHTIDYESMSLQDPLYAFAYSLVHLELKDDNQISRDDFLKIAREQVLEKIINKENFEDRMRLNIAEVCSYLILETMRENPNFQEINNVQGKLNKLKITLKEIL